MAEQFSLPGFDIDSRPSDRLLFAVRPDPDAAGRAAKLRVGGKRVLEDHLHITLHHLGDYHGLPADLVARALEAGAAVTAAPFHVAFDRLMNFGRGQAGPLSVLSGDADIGGVVDFQRTLGAAMARAGLARKVETAFTPHMTLSYGGPGLDKQAVGAIGWTVGDFVLIHSLLGQTRHIVLGRWPLRG